MKKIILSALILAVVSAGVVFAQDDDFSYMPKNTITIDIGPTVAGLLFGGTSDTINGIGNLFGIPMDMGGFKTSGFGIGAQYERHLLERLSVAGRFAYMQMGTGFGLADSAGIEMGVTSFSIEGHIRYFFDESMFIDGMLGYANMTASIKGKVDTASSSIVDVDFQMPRNYFKYGIKLGWRFDFGEPGGFIFEPSVGWSFGMSKEETLVQKTINEVGKKIDKETGSGYGTQGMEILSSSTKALLDPLTWGLDNLIFVGGPRLSLAIGWSF